MVLANDKIQRLKYFIGYFNVKFAEKLVKKNYLQCFGALE